MIPAPTTVPTRLSTAARSSIAAQAVGMSGADIAAVVHAARAQARHQKRGLVLDDLFAALAEVRTARSSTNMAPSGKKPKSRSTTGATAPDSVGHQSCPVRDKATA